MTSWTWSPGGVRSGIRLPQIPLNSASGRQRSHQPEAQNLTDQCHLSRVHPPVPPLWKMCHHQDGNNPQQTHKHTHKWTQRATDRTGSWVWSLWVLIHWASRVVSLGFRLFHFVQTFSLRSKGKKLRLLEWENHPVVFEVVGLILCPVSTLDCGFQSLEQTTNTKIKE